jgi:hypothetical protein
VNATARTDTFDHVAKLGRERGKESPIAVSPAMANLTGRIDDSTMLCRPIKGTLATNAAPRTEY